MTKHNLKSGFLFATIVLFVALTGAPHANAIAGTELQITNDPGYQFWPAIYGDKIVWVNEQGPDDLYLYTISTGEQRLLATSDFYKRNLQMRGDIITWFDGSGGFYLYDIRKGEEKSFANESIRPDPWGVGIYDNMMVFSATSPEGGDKDIFLYDITTGTTTRITSDPTPEVTPAIYGNKVVFLNSSPWWSEDSQKAGVYVYDLETRELIKINSGPTYNANSLKIYENTVAWVETSSTGGPLRYLHIYDLETKTDTTVDTIGAPSFGYLSIFRDKIVWVGTDLVSSKNGIYLYDIPTGEQSRISSDTAEPWGYDGQDIHEGGVVWSDFRSGTTYDIYLYQFASPNNPPTLSFPTTGLYAGDGIDPNSGDTTTEFNFRVFYTDADNNPPSFIDTFLFGHATTTVPMSVDTAAEPSLQDGNYVNGEQYAATARREVAGTHYYAFEASDGTQTIQLWGVSPLEIADPVPTNKNQCKNGGWKTFTDPYFKNQGQCVSYVQANEKAKKH